MTEQVYEECPVCQGYGVLAGVYEACDCCGLSGQGIAPCYECEGTGLTPHLCPWEAEDG